MNVFVFKIETVPDIDSCRRLYDLHGLSDDDVAKTVFHKRRQQANTEVLPHHLQKIVAISAVLRNREQFRVWSLGDVASSEEELLQRFFSGIERYSPDLVSWSGMRFDLPVVHYRSLLYPVNAGQYWNPYKIDISSQQSDNRYHQRHTALTEVLNEYLPELEAPLCEIAGLCGFPGRAGEIAIDVWQTYLEDNLQLIRSNGETDVLNTYLIYLRFLCNKGQIDPQNYQYECNMVRQELKNSSCRTLAGF